MEDFWYGMEMEWKKIVSMEYGKIVFHSIPYHACLGFEAKAKDLSFEAKAKDFKMCPRGRPRCQERPRGLHLCLKSFQNNQVTSI